MSDYTTQTPNTTTFTTQAPAEDYVVVDYVVTGYVSNAGPEQWTIVSAESTTWL